MKELRDERIRKLNEIREMGVDPYPSKTNKDTKIGDIINDFKKFDGKKVTVAGRVIGIRKFGKIAFVVIRDFTGEIQLFLKDGDIDGSQKDGKDLDNLRLFDPGDFVEATGEVGKTQTGEISVIVRRIKVLSKSLRPLPTKQDGFSNKEERLRRRYVDMNVNLDVRDRFVRRSKFWQATRDFLNKNEFIEINTPVLEHTTGGADANPFTTHMDALDSDFYLRISHELPLKRLIGAGFERVYDIGPRFRNENYSDEHLPEHIAMEWYAAYWDWHDGMKFMEKLFKEVLQKTFGTLKFELGEFKVDMSKKWEVWDYGEVIQKEYGIDVYNATIDEVKKALKANKLEVEKTENLARGIDKLWKKIRATVAGPVWLTNVPLFISPLAKTNADGKTTQRFHAIIAGSELCNGFSELNDPQEQLNRFVEQQKMRDAGDNEAMMLDIDFVEMLEYGMPPACGLGFSERVFWIFESVSAREGVPFPHLRAEVDEVTKGIYPELKLK